MTHTGPMHESDGTLSAALPTSRFCKKCDKYTDHTEQMWESSCGGYEDYKYVCAVCGAVHWVDGIDS
jgi:hypothetical protein